MRIVVTGASGNLGTAVLRRLLDDGHDVVGISRRRPADVEPYAGVTWHCVDVADPGAVEHLRLPFTGADAVVHLVWAFQPTHRRGYLRATGVHGIDAVLEAAAAGRVAHVVHISSSAVYAPGAHDHRVDESWPATGVPTSVYSRDKVAAETRVWSHVATGAAPAVTVLRPGLIGQYEAGTQLLRYVLPDWLPESVARHVPALPIDRRLCIPAVHADDVADAVMRALGTRRPGVYNVAADTAATGADVVAGFGVLGVPVPAAVLRVAAQVSWRLRLQPVDGGWIDLAYATPLLDCTRLRNELGWRARTDGPDVVRELAEGVVDRAGTGSPVLRPRSYAERLVTALRRGPVGRREPP